MKIAIGLVELALLGGQFIMLGFIVYYAIKIIIDNKKRGDN